MSNNYYTINIHIKYDSNSSIDVSGVFTVDPVTNFLTSFYYIRNHNDKPIVFVGLDAELCLGLMEDSDVYYNLYSKYNYFILSSDNTLKQRFFRQIEKLNKRKEEFFTEWLKNPDKIQDKLFRFVNLNEWKINNNKCDELYHARNYEFLTSEEIYSNVSKLISNI